MLRIWISGERSEPEYSAVTLPLAAITKLGWVDICKDFKYIIYLPSY